MPEQRNSEQQNPEQQNEVIEAAAEWHLKMQSANVTEQDRAAFSEWLAASPQHAHEYFELDRIWQALPELQGDVDMPGGSESEAEGVEEVQRKPVYRRWSMAAAVASVAVAAAIGFTVMQPEPPVAEPQRLAYVSSPSGVERVELPDGSMIHLNADSEVRVDYNNRWRDVVLVRGEAYFDVRPDVYRPFIVKTPSAMLRVIGTRFNVFDTARHSRITVLEGQVDVRQRQPHDRPVVQSIRWQARLDPGQQVLVPSADVQVVAGDLSVRQPERLGELIAWHAYDLEFQDAALTEVLREFNRYNDQVTLTTDPGLGDIRITGTFAALDVDTLIAALDAMDEVRVVRDGQKIEIK